VHINYNKKAWLTKGIKISCQQKRDLYILYKTTSNPNFKHYYKSYTKILTAVIKAAKKKKHYNKLFSRSKNKVKTMWNLVRSETNKQGNKNELHLNIEGKSVTDFHELANIFNDYFINVTHTTQVENFNNTPSALDSLNLSCTKSFSQIHFTPVTAN